MSSYSPTVARTCPACGATLSAHLRDAFCPVCTLHGALHLDEDTPESLDLLRRIGDYELIEEVARGGVGIVFRARQLRLDREVAIKLLLAGHFADPAAQARFQTEASAAARLRHPNIVEVFEVGEHEGQPFLAMEFMEGGTLADTVRGGPLPSREAAAHVAKVARAVAFAHDHGVLHRDLKPSNILLDQFGEPRITDFGLAKVLGQDAHLTLTGQVLGSPGFMAPEQAGGDHARVGEPADVYALGAILYHLTTGRPPFHGDSAAAVLRQVERDEAIQPRRLSPGLPIDLETVILKCLEKSPARRYASATALADDLDRFLTGRPVLARPLSPFGRAWRWARRRPASALLLIGVLTIAIGSNVAALRIRHAERRTQEHLRSARLHAYAGDLALADRAIEEGDLARTRELLLRHVPVPGEPEVRTYEWRRLWYVSEDQSLANLTGHTHLVSSLAFYPDGKRLISGSWDGTVRLWDLAERQCVQVLTNYGGRIWNLHLARDGRRLLISGAAGAQVWQTETWREIARIPGDFSYGTAWFCGTNDQVIVTATRARADLWDASQGHHRIQLTNAAAAAAPSRDGRELMTRSGEILRVWDSDSSRLLQEFTTKGLISFGLRDVSLSPAGEAIAVGSFNGSLALLSRGAPTNFLNLEGRSRSGNRAHFGWISDLAFSPDGRLLVSTSADHEVAVWNMRTRQLARRLHGHLHEVWAAAFSPDGALLATGGKDETIKLWEPNRPRPNATRLTAPFTLGLWSSHEILRERSPGSELQRSFLVTDWRTRRTTREITVSNATPAECVFAAASHGIVGLGLRNGTVELWDLRPDPPVRLHSLPASPQPLRGGVFAADATSFAVTDAAGNSTVWDTSSGRRRLELKGTPVLALDHDFVVARPTPETPRVVDAKTGAALADLVGHKEDVPQVAFLPDRQRLATISWDGSLRLWHLPAGRQLASFRFQRQGVYALAVSPDGRTLAAAGQDGITRFWDIRTQQETMRSLGVDAVLSVWFTPDGTELVQNEGKHVRIIHAPTLAEIEASPSFKAAFASRSR